MSKLSFISLSILISTTAFASTEVELYSAPMSSLKQFQIKTNTNNKLHALAAPKPQENTLVALKQSVEAHQSIQRYQQTYKGIPVVDGQVVIVNDAAASTLNGTVNGHLLQDVQLDTKPAFDAAKALELAKTDYFSTNLKAAVIDAQASLQIRANDKNELKLVYLVHFKSTAKDNKPVWPFFVIDAQTGDISKQWNNIKNYVDTGPGGNEKTGKYWYGKSGLPGLDVTQNGANCIMDSAQVKLVNVNFAWDYQRSVTKAYQYLCGQNKGDTINRAYSPINDAYYFGHVVVDMYQKWYAVNALQTATGTPMKLTMRVHFGQKMDNAFWDGETMNFGDGNDLYPLVSLDIAGHEVSHGFTQHHSDLEYHDQPGALNESFSDMAGQATRAYLLEQDAFMYGQAFLGANQVNWNFGETVTPAAFGNGLRFMDYPSSDGASADCLDKSLAQSSGSYCAMSYQDVVNFANSGVVPASDIQDYIVHTGSGVFNKAFYLMSNSFGIKESFHLMVIANSKYWTSTSDFKESACGVLHAAKDLKLDRRVVVNAFNQVGVDTSGCAH